jgi:hypothetical protein
MPFTPYDAARETVSRARGVLAAGDSPNMPTAVSADLRRLSVVMAVAALDTYMHRLVVARAYEHEALPGGLAALSVTFEQLLAEADDAVQARRDDRDSRPRVRVKRVLRDRLQRETFQSADDVSRALGMAGKSGQWDAIAAAMSGSARGDSKALRALLNEFVRRRNGIVHEGDYERLERPRTAKLVPLGRAAADDAVEFFSDLIDAMHRLM